MAEIKVRKGARARAYVELWADWKQSGNAPATRGEAISILSKKMTDLGPASEVNKAFLALKRAHGKAGEDGDQLNDSLSFIVWDLLENSGKAMDYRVHSNFFGGLLQQATNLIYTYTRVSLKVGKLTLTMPSVVYMPGRGAMRMVDIPQSSLSAIADEFVDDAKIRMIRWKSVGANQKFVKQVLKKLAASVLAEF